MTSSPDHSVERFIELARQSALADNSTGAVRSSVVRECHAWPRTVVDSLYGADELRHAIQDALGPSRESVFSFLRYFAYAKWDSDRRALVMGSEQLDRYLPLHVYWELTSSGLLFQRSEQPAYAGDRLDVRELTRYVGDAVDCVGQLYGALNVSDLITVDLSFPGVQGLRGDEVETRCDPTVLVWSNSHSADEWVMGRDELAMSCVSDLVAQCSGRLRLENPIEAGLASEFERLDARRMLVS